MKERSTGREGVLHEAAHWWTRLRGADRDEQAAARWLEWTGSDAARLDAFERIDELAGRLGALDAHARAALLREFAPARRRWLPFAAAAAAVIVAIAVAVFAFGWRGAAPAPAEQFATAVGATRDIALSDGSHVAIGGASELHALFGPSLRRVDLTRGEAYFEVAHDVTRPFVVAAGAVSIRAVGTAFNVRRTGERVTVAVTQGRVRITGIDGAGATRAGGAFALEAVAGQQVSYDPHASGLAVASVSPGQATGWRERRLDFINEPLEVVAANINRYGAHPLRIADARTGALTFTGTVHPDALDAWLKALPKILPVRVARSDDAVELSSGEAEAR